MALKVRLDAQARRDLEEIRSYLLSRAGAARRTPNLADLKRGP